MKKRSYIVKIEKKMSSLTMNKKDSKKSMKEVNKSYSWDETGPDCVSEVKPVPTKKRGDKHLKHTTKRQKIQDIEFNSPEQRSLVDESNLFLIKTLIVWVLICLPGNIFALTIFYKHEENLKPNEQIIEYNIENHSISDTQMDTLRQVERIKESPLMLDNDTTKVTNFNDKEIISNNF